MSKVRRSSAMSVKNGGTWTQRSARQYPLLLVLVLLAAAGCRGASRDTSRALPSPPSSIQFLATSDLHYGITRKTFRGGTNVSARDVNAALVAQMNGLPAITLPADGGLRAGQRVGSTDFVAVTGDIANRAEEGVQAPAASWAQFRSGFVDALTLRAPGGQPTSVFPIPGNHDVTNAIGFYKPMVPPVDATPMAEMYNMTLKPRVARTKESYSYARDKVHYSRDIRGVRFIFLNVWPDAAERAWLATELRAVSSTTPVVLFAHDQPDVESKHFTNPNGASTVNPTDKFENVLGEVFKSGTTVDVPAVQQQRAFATFLASRPNIKAYFHGNDNSNEFYVWRGPDGSAALNSFRLDSPMKGNISADDETKLSFQLVTIDARAKRMTVREVLWNAAPANPSAPITWGASRTVSLR